MQTTATQRFRLLILATLVMASLTLSPSFAAISWDGGGGNSWWFDPVNWSTHGAGAVAPFLVPATNNGTSVTDTNLNNGWDNTGEGVVYDPVNDPFYASLTDADYDYPSEEDPRFDRNTIWRLYVTTGGAETDNKLTIKSGELEVINSPGSGGYVLVGRGGATPGLKGTVVQTGGSFLVRDENIDIGQFSTSPGNGVYEYYGGVLEAGLVSATNKGIRLSAGGSAGSASSGYLGVHNGGEPGHIRAWNFTVAAYFDATFGSTNSVSTVEFFANQDGTRPIQVMNNLSINHQDDSAGLGGKRSAVLKLSLDAAPALLDGSVPINLGLFDVQGLIQGVSGIFYNDSIDNGGTPINEGDMVSAMIGSSTYNWTISYSGNINWNDFDNSLVGPITGSGTGNDIVLIGHSADVQGTPGDFDGDGDVDGRDFLVWQRGDSPSPLSAADLATWQTAYGTGSLAAAVAVPEPGTCLLCLGFLAMLGRRRA